MTVEERFWAKVDTTGDGCWEWQGAKKPTGYGNFRFNGAMKMAHRVVWELTQGPIPEGAVVLHQCDNPSCVRPEHLVIGTQADNVADAVAKGRHQRGERNGRSKLTVAEVKEIRRIYDNGGFSQRRLGEMYGVAEEQIRNIVRRVNWRDV